MDFAEKPPHNSDPFSLLHGPGPGPETPRKTIHAYLQQLSREHDLELPWDDTESPSKRRRTPAHDVAKDICFLYFQDRAALDVAIEEFRRWLPFGNVEEKLTYLLDRLTIARTNCMKKRTPQNRSLRASPQRPAGAAALPEPLSPTLSIKHAPNSRVEMPADDFQLPPVRTMRRPSLKTSRSNQSMTEKIRVPALNERQPRYPDLSSALHFENAEKKPEPFPSSGEMAPPRKRAASRNAGLASVNISFTSTNAGLTSADTSFWSEVHQGTQDPESPATSIGDSFHTPDAKDRELDGADDPDHSRMTTNYGSSPKLDDDDEPLKHDEARPRKTDGVTESTQSEYGGAFSLPTQSYDEIFAHMGTQRAAADNDRHLTPSPPHTNPRSETHELTGFARVEKIVRDGLRNQCLPAWLCDLPFEIRWEAARILQTKKISSNDLCLHWQSERDLDSLYSLVRQLRIPFVPGDKGIGTNSSYVANMRWAKSATGPVFDLELLRPARDKSTSLERKFGRSNFLYINLTPLSKCHKSTKLDHYEKDISDQVLEMFQREQHLLGRVWRQFHVQVRKSTTAGDPDFEKTGARQFFLFAVRDEGKDDRSSTSVPIVEVWDWAVPCCKNLKMRVPKAFARVDLMASRTLSGHRLAKDEIVRINDFMPTSDPDDTTFDEAQVLNAEVSDQPMNDGCNRIATWLMVRLVRACNLNYLPSAVQGRINGAKGVWYRDNGNHLDDEKPDKLLWISDSQTKVLQTDACWDDDEKMTFNVVRFSGPTGRAELYADFIRIMADRKVPWSNICKAVMDSASEFVQPFKDAYENPGAMRFWMHCQNKFHEERNRANGIDTIGGFPVSREEHINHLLETGFDWRECEYLANEISAAASTIFGDAQVHLRLEMLCATMPLGIVDETGVVAPGEVHFIPSKPFNDAQGVPMMLRGRHTVVGRLPALGPSDMQKMRIVQKESLAHLVDVLVFSRKGPRSQASKLQGGDYDGDMWVQSSLLLIISLTRSQVLDLLGSFTCGGLQECACQQHFEQTQGFWYPRQYGDCWRLGPYGQQRPSSGVRCSSIDCKGYEGPHAIQPAWLTHFSPGKVDVR